jgi:hypothetical protein
MSGAIKCRSCKGDIWLVSYRKDLGTFRLLCPTKGCGEELVYQNFDFVESKRRIKK